MLICLIGAHLSIFLPVALHEISQPLFQPDQGMPKINGFT